MARHARRAEFNPIKDQVIFRVSGAANGYVIGFKPLTPR